MGTGFGMHTNVAATIMRDEAKKLRNHIATLAMKVKDYDESSKEERRKIEQLSGEAQKLESAARLMDPQTEPHEMMGEDAAPERPTAQTRPETINITKASPVHRIDIVAYNHSGGQLRSATITQEEIEDGFLSTMPNLTIWLRLRKVAGLE